MSYDSWLEAPYQEQYRLDDLYVAFCEETDRDPHPDAGDHGYAFEQWMAEQVEAAAETRAEEIAEARAYNAEHDLQ